MTLSGGGCMKQSHSGGDLSRQEGNAAKHAEGFGELLENASDLVHTIDLAGNVEIQRVELIMRLAALNEAATALENAHGNEAQVERIPEPEAMQHHLEDAYVQMVLALARAMDARDAYTEDHGERLAALAARVARALGLPDVKHSSTRGVVEAFMQIEIFDPHTGGWKDQATATRGRAQAVALTA